LTGESSFVLREGLAVRLVQEKYRRGKRTPSLFEIEEKFVESKETKCLCETGMKFRRRDVAQLVARSFRVAEAPGSSPGVPTISDIANFASSLFARSHTPSARLASRRLNN
jgi:hypothetical protein